MLRGLMRFIVKFKLKVESEEEYGELVNDA